MSKQSINTDVKFCSGNYDIKMIAGSNIWAQA